MTIADFVRNLGLVVLPFTLYFAWTKIGYRVIAQPTWNTRRHAASGIGRLTLINMKDRSLAVFHVHATFKGVSIPLRDFDPPLIIKAYEAVHINIPEVSSYYLRNQQYKWNIADASLQKIDIYLSTASKTVKCKHGSPPHRIAFARKKNLALVTTISNQFNNKVYNENVKYAIGYRLDGEERTAFVDNAGFIDWGMLPNMLAEEHLGSAVAVKAALDTHGIGKHLHPYFVEALHQKK